MKRLLYSMTAASVAALVALASSSPVRASDKPTADPAQNTAGNEPNVPAQNASPAEAKGTTTATVNVDIQGIISLSSHRDPKSLCGCSIYSSLRVFLCQIALTFYLLH